MVNRIRRLCSDNKTSIKALERELGFGNGTIRRWNENTPSVERIVAVANYFNVPVSYLTGWNDAVSNLNNVGMSEIDVAEEMGIDPSVMNSILSGNDVYSAEAVSKFVRVASLLSEQKEKPTLQTEGELTADQIKAIEKIRNMPPEELAKKMAALEAVLDM